MNAPSGGRMRAPIDCRDAQLHPVGNTRPMRIRGHLLAMLGAMGSLRSHPAMLRLVASMILRWGGTSMAMVALLVVAYTAAGATGVAILGAARMIPAAIVAALTGRMSEQVGHERLLVAAYLVRAAAMALAAVAVALGLPIAAVLASSAVSAAAGALIRPLHAGVLPHVAQTPGELIAANVATSTGEGIATLAGPALGGVLVVAGGPAGTLGLATIIALAAAALAGSARATSHVVHRHTTGDSLRRPGVGALAALRAHPGAMLVVAGFGAQTFVRGLLTTMIVVLALGPLGFGEAGVGWLAAVLGAGGLASALLSGGSAVRGRMGSVFVVALACWGLPIAVIGLVPMPLVAIGSLLVTGFANGMLDVAGYTLLQRIIPTDARVNVLGFLEALIGVAVAAGSLASPLLLAAMGTQGALLVTGAILPAAAALIGSRLRSSSEGSVVPEHELSALSRVALFAPLPLATIEDLARAAKPAAFPRGEVLMREGEAGDRFLVITAGRVEVSQHDRVLRSCGPGEGVGEIALLRHVPRTATVRAADDTTAYVLTAGPFIAAVTGHAIAAATAESIVNERLGPVSG